MAEPEARNAKAMNNGGTGDLSAVPPGSEVKQWLKGLAKAHNKGVNGTAVAGLLAGLATIVQMTLLATIIHQGLVEKVDLAALTPYFLGLLATLGIRALAQGWQTTLASRCSQQVRHQVRQQLNDCWEASGPVNLNQSSAGTHSREWLDHVDALHGYFARFLPQMLIATLLPLMILAFVFWLDWLAGLFLLFAAPLIPLFMALVGMGAESLNQQHFQTVSRLSGQFLDKVRGLTTLQLFQQTGPAAEVLQQRSDQYRFITMKTLRLAFLSSAVLEFFSSVAIAVVAMYVGFGLLGSIAFGPAPDLTLFSGLLVLLLAPEFFQPLRTLSQHYHDRASALGAGAEILSRLNSSGTIGSRVRPTPSQDSIGIMVHDVSFGFGKNKLLFDRVSFSVGRGQALALTGPSGGGKSTLLNMIAGFIAPQSGAITIFDKAPGQQAFGWLGQKGFLVDGTWADNLRLTAPQASDSDVAAALEQVGLGPLLALRSDGIHSKVMEDGQGLSGGQSRRLSLARILVADYDLILLDEPTAALDADSEQHIVQTLSKLKQQGKTLVFSSHHTALLTLADRVLQVVDGRLQAAPEGGHDD
ncbi:thiol reductant ABC exporter subunit CydD [Marinobacter sp. M3C]|uniref:thiol reductant ABC exporter subunit CydD n=1 Tax=unclassified Marinobacter TaxID=83889 RepID=UPI00200C2AF2|nr:MULTISPECIES: thiol reductant ABC exporter subunit CydD [unclassified Marinobacter]MCL1476183.1 thiol reductant ABC exporter subunit CydD [Marinobacter sp.]MCL1482735.1 thiol reductant ABC exporter subunit CydD [Marinobacter sp.]MCL1482934.1 thiol reductant ABC exporter subunit CydD [Marinobacter sp.]UQG54047.1 thiol reductant ABC exporter subunit CydD [Marinobacter sp. M4C]UQG60545.1 thiol reductant ABC exporter subunit CydD [Marinobacter sp. M3C]